MTDSSNALQFSTADDFLLWYLSHSKPHTKSLISTLFGDLIQPSGGKAWVETIVQVLEPLQIKSRLVRTTLFRLCEDEWLFATRVGRKSYYQLTQQAKNITDDAEKIIYFPVDSQWNGIWNLVLTMTDSIESEKRHLLEQQLKYLGFGKLAKRAWAHPNVDMHQLEKSIKALDLDNKVLCLQAKSMEGLSFVMQDKAILAQWSPLLELEKQYLRFRYNFEPIKCEIDAICKNSTPLSLVTLRVLLIDEFRRIVLSDPMLPECLLPSSWWRQQAWDLCREIYQALEPKTQAYYVKTWINDSMFAPTKNQQQLPLSYQQRFTLRQ